ncbi:MAG: hypothetical protein A3F46_02515 [Legionellales bacterium RIFCSPHIGHO2_12_FULL_42_9]|nr:MAG: hypothetical protein A3F46_02515 [Legionellales bacterium RIFCSPHIGHO2_12_FULL_42_9]
MLIHLDSYLVSFVAEYGSWTYLVVTAVIFCETGLIVTPFLPGDSLLFALGTIAAQPTKPLNAIVLFVFLASAAFFGNQVNYAVGRVIGPRLFARDHLRFINKQNLLKAHAFYEKHGGKTIVFARFMPIIRTFVPFVAGLSAMEWYKFMLYNGVSAILWVGSLLGFGYFFGSLPIIKDHFALVVYGIVIVSLLPSLVGILLSKE